MVGENRGPARQAVLVFVDETSAGVASSESPLRILLRSWIIISACALIAGLGAITYSLLAPKWYRAQAILVPVHDDESGSSLGAIGGQLGGLASLVGLGTGSDEDRKQENLVRLSSREFTYDFLRSEGVIPVLFADRWDARAQRWKSVAEEPSLETAYRYFVDKVRTVSEDRRTNVIKVTIDWKDPVLAAAWANKIVARINADRRATARAESERNLEFLNRELERAGIVELRQAINHLIELEIRKLMLVNVREQYSFKIIDPAFVPGVDAVVWPRIAMLTAVALLLGGLVGAGIALGRSHRAQQMKLPPVSG
jgi:capsular polysaccharide biosynthesis protein